MGFVLRKIEQVIYHALQKIDARNPQLREKIYHTVWYSHEKMMRDHQNLTQEEKTQKRKQLTHLIQTIEAAYRPPQPVVHELASAPPNLAALEVARQDAPSKKLAHLDAADGAALMPSSERIQAPHQYKRSWLRTHALLLILALIFLLVLWSFYNSLVGNPSAILNPTTPPASATKSSSAQARQENRPAAVQNSGIRIFDPNDMMVLTPQGSAYVTLHDEGEERFARIHSRAPQDGAVIEIGEGVMVLLKGKTGIFDAMMRSASPQTIQLSLTCDFGPDINCGRRHFDILPKRENVLFRVDIPEDAAMRGKIFIHHTSSEDEGALDLFDMRVRVQ